MTDRGYGEDSNKNTTAVSETYYLRTDRLGSTYAVNDRGGNTLVSTQYNEWGELESTLSAQNTKATGHSTAVQTLLVEEVGTNYTGYEYDEVLDMYYACDRI